MKTATICVAAVAILCMPSIRALDENRDDPELGTPRPKTRPTEHNTSVLGLGLVVGGEALYLPLTELERVRSFPLLVRLGGERIRIHYRRDAMTAWATDEGGQLLAAVLAYEFGWTGFFPESRIYRAGAETAPGGKNP